MFARVVEFTPKMEKKDELIKAVRQEVLPILRKQPGFLELMPFVPEIEDEKAIAITLWAEKHHAERYVKDVLPKVEQILKPFMITKFAARTYEVETTLCQHLVDALTAVA